MTKGLPAIAPRRARRGSQRCAAAVRLLAAIALGLCTLVAGGKAPPATFEGTVSFAEGDPFTIIRHDLLLSGSKGVVLAAGDLLETAPNAFLVVQEPDGSLIGIGPSTQVYFVDRGEDRTLFVLKGWIKADTKAAPTRVLGTRLGLQGHQAVMLLYASEQSSAAYDEQGTVTVLLPDAGAAPAVREPGLNHFFAREGRFDVRAQLSPSAEFVKQMPVAFRDPLPAFQKLPQPVPPQRLRPVGYADIQDWLTLPPEWRSGFIGRFRGRLQDPAFFAAMDAHRAQFPEWIPVLHPPPGSDPDRARE